jgi:hypothetical protein
MTMVAAITIGAANRSRCAAGLCPCPFRRTGFDQKKTFVVPDAVVLLSHPSDHSVSDINRIKRHIVFVPLGEPCAIANNLFLATFPLLLRHVKTAVESGDGGHIAAHDVPFLLL